MWYISAFYTTDQPDVHYFSKGVSQDFVSLISLGKDILTHISHVIHNDPVI